MFHTRTVFLCSGSTVRRTEKQLLNMVLTSEKKSLCRAKLRILTFRSENAIMRWIEGAGQGPAGLRKKGDPDVRTVRCRTRNRTPAYGGGADAFLAGYGQDGGHSVRGLPRRASPRQISLRYICSPCCVRRWPQTDGCTAFLRLLQACWFSIICLPCRALRLSSMM